MQDNLVVPDEFCIHQLGSMVQVTQPCHVTCESEVCKFSEWSEYGSCTQRCGGHRVRSRTMEGLRFNNHRVLYAFTTYVGVRLY